MTTDASRTVQEGECGAAFDACWMNYPRRHEVSKNECRSVFAAGLEAGQRANAGTSRLPSPMESAGAASGGESGLREALERIASNDGKSWYGNGIKIDDELYVCCMCCNEAAPGMHDDPVAIAAIEHSPNCVVTIARAALSETKDGRP